MIPDPLTTLFIGLLVLAGGLMAVWPKAGLLSRWRQARRMTRRVLSEDALKHIYDVTLRGQRPTLSDIAGTLQISTNQAATLLADLECRQLLAIRGDEINLTPAGREAALHVLRAHRLWERHLAEDTGFTETEWHLLADRVEHELSPDQTDALDARLGHPARDPHGDPIPTSGGELIGPSGIPLACLPIGQPAHIVHVEDEPEAVYAQLVAQEVFPGQKVRLLEVSPQRVRFWANGNEHVVAPIVAANVSVVPIAPSAELDDSAGEPLHQLRPNESGTVIRISPRCRGPERRRLMDLGILPGTLIRAEIVSPAGDPTAYRIRGAVIALRREQAGLIRITRLQEATE